MTVAEAPSMKSAERRTTALRSAPYVLLLTLPALVFLGAFYLLPLAKLVATSLEAPDLSLEQYKAFFTDDVYLRVLVKTFRLAIVTTVLCVLLGYPVAYFLNNTTPGLRKFCFLLIVIPYLTSFLVRAYALIILLSDRGVVNGLLLWLGAIEEPFRLVYNSIGVQVGMVHVMLPFMILPLYGTMYNIDRRLTQAAYSLGAGPVSSFLRVYLRLSMPGVVSGSILVLVLSIGFYITPALLGGLGDVMLVNLIDVQAMQLGNWEFAAAASIILLILTLLGFVLLGALMGEGGLVGLLTGEVSQSDSRISRARGLGILLRSLGELLRLSVLLRAVAVLRRKGAAGVLYRRPGPDLTRLIQPVSLVVVALVLAFLISPSFIVLPMSFSSAEFITFPPPGWSTKWYVAFFSQADWVQSLFNSIQVAFGSVLLSTVLGTLAAYAVVRRPFAGRTIAVLFFISPIVVPPIIVGIGLYGYYVSWGLFGTLPGLILAHSIGGTALCFISVAATLARFDFRLEQASMSLGAGPIMTFAKVTLPLIKPGIAAGALFSFINSFDELVITMLIVGIRHETLPIKIWNNLRNEIDPVIAAVSVLLILLPVLWLLLLTASQHLSRTESTKSGAADAGVR